jgi:hypothetical protein
MSKLRAVLVIVLATTLSARAGVVSFDLAPAAEKDVVSERGVGATAERAGENAEANQAFVEQGNMQADGLPGNRSIESPAGIGRYKLLPYDGSNAIELSSHADAAAESHAIDVPDATYSRIGLLVASVDGDSSFTIKLMYADGTESIGWFEADDWYQPQLNRGNCMPAAANMDRVNTATGELEDANHFQLYEFVFTGVDATKVLDRLVLGNDPNRFDSARASWGLVFAINGEAVGP